jgi:hypothetical protein
MNQRSDIDRLLRHWMDDGPTRMPDRIVDVVADRISVQRQRRSWRLLRRLPMNTYVKLGAAIAAALVVAVIGWNLLPGLRPGVGDTSPTPTPSPTAVATPAPTVLPDLRSGALAPGRYRAIPLDGVSGLAVTFEVPAGWEGFPDWAVLGPNGTEDPGGAGVGFLSAEGLFSDPCHWDASGSGHWPQAGDVPVGPTAADLATALLAGRPYQATAGPDVVVDGYPAKRVDVTMPSDVDFKACDGANEVDEGAYFIWGTRHSGGSDLYVQGPGNRWRLWIVDVDDARLIIVLSDFPATLATDRSAAEAIVASVTIEP